MCSAIPSETVFFYLTMGNNVWPKNIAQNKTRMYRVNVLRFMD
jgi:hypothetical protein